MKRRSLTFITVGLFVLMMSLMTLSVSAKEPEMVTLPEVMVQSQTLTEMETEGSVTDDREEKQSEWDESVPMRTTITAAANDLKAFMENRQAVCLVSYRDYTGADYTALAKEIFYKAMEHDGAGNHGDYLLWGFKNYVLGGYKREDNEKSYTEYQFRYEIEYYTTVAQENQVTNRLNSAYASFNFTKETTILDKVKTIYKYIVLTTGASYDKTPENSLPDLSFTSYGILFNKKGVCQGFATLLYRMCLDNGIDVRMITGKGNSGNHGWNIIKMGDGLYYACDPTWDLGSMEKDYRYFLKADTTRDFPNHVRVDYWEMKDEKQVWPVVMYTSSDFKAKYPTGTKNYQESSYTGINKISDVLYEYWKNGAIDTTVSGLLEIPELAGKYYFRNGRMDFQSTGILESGGKKYAILNSRFAEDITGLQRINGIWYALKNGIVDTTVTGIRQNPENSSWIYFEAGKQNINYSGLVLYGGTYYYVENGILGWGRDTLTKYYSTTYYVQNSTLRWGVSGLTYIEGTWYYLENSQLQSSYTGLVQYAGKWFYVENGVLNWDYTGLTQYGSTWYYVQNSQLNWGVEALVKYYTTIYYVQNSTLKWGVSGLTYINGTWYYLVNSQLQTNYTSLVQYSGTWYYVQNGRLNWGVEALVNYYGTTYYVQNSTLRWGVSGLTYINGTWYYLVNSQLQTNYTSLVQYSGTWYYVQNGRLNWGVEALVKYYGTTYYVQNSTLKWGVNGTVTVGGKKYTLRNSQVVE